jgi:hypothetical protein
MCFLFKTTKEQVYNDLEVKTRQVANLEIVLEEKERDLEDMARQFDIERAYYDTVIEELKIRIDKLEMEKFRRKEVKNGFIHRLLERIFA